jgi:hypothetical protein
MGDDNRGVGDETNSDGLAGAMREGGYAYMECDYLWESVLDRYEHLLERTVADS